MKCLSSVLLVGMAAFGATVAEEAPPKPAPNLEPAEAVKQLGSDDYETRQAAVRALVQAGASAKGALEAAKNAQDIEVRRHVNVLLMQIEAREGQAEFYTQLHELLGTVLGADLGKLPKLQAADDKNAPAAADGEKDTLRWLCDRQEDDGHWDSLKHGAQVQADVEQTALALLALLGAGHTEKVGIYKVNVRKAVAWLIKQQREDGAFLRPGEKEPIGLVHALGMLALAEASGMGRIAETVKAAEKAVNYCADHQSKRDGQPDGWGAARRSDNPDLFTSTFFVLALKSSKVAGLHVNPECFDGVIHFLERMDRPDAKAFVVADGAKPSYQAAIMGSLCRLFLGWKNDDVQPYLDGASKIAEQSLLAPSNFDDVSSYFYLLGVFHFGGEIFQDYQKSLDVFLRAHQDAKGAWKAPGVWAGMGQVGGTALTALSFAVRLRFQRLTGQ